MLLFKHLQFLPWIWGVLFSIILFVIFTIAGLVIVRRTTDWTNLRAHHDVAGFVYTNLGVLYGVLLGFTVVNVQQRFDKMKEIAQIEAGYLTQLYRDAEIFPNHNRQAIRDAIISYAENVVHQEWQLMIKGIKSQSTIQALENIWNAYYAVDLSTAKEQAWYTESINKLNLLMNARLSRLLGSQESLGLEMWSSLVVGGIVMTAFTWFFGLENIKSHLLMSIIIAASIASLLFLIYSLDTAFSGGVNISPDAMNEILQSF